MPAVNILTTSDYHKSQEKLLAFSKLTENSLENHIIWESPDFQNFHIFDKSQLASNESRFRIDSVSYFYKIRRKPEF